MKDQVLEQLKKEGFTGNDVGVEALLFCGEIVNVNTVDCPVKLRDAEAKLMAKKCNEFKKLEKEIIKLMGSPHYTVLGKMIDEYFKNKNLTTSL